MLEPYWNKDFVFNGSHRQLFEYLGYNKISDQLVFVHESTINPNETDVVTAANILNQYRKETNRLPVLSLDSNLWDTQNFLHELDKHIDHNQYFVLLSDYNDHSRTNAGHWPFFLLAQQLETNHQVNRPKNRRISFLSGTMRFYRYELFSRIQSHIRHNDVVVINKFSPNHFINTIPRGMGSQINVDEVLKKLPWANDQTFLDTPQDNNCAASTQSNDHPAFSACVNITGESGVGEKLPFISEKTWKAYRSGCLVINYGPEDLPNYLSSLGVQTWKDFDRSESVESKINTIVELFQRDDIEQLYADNLEIVKHNQNLIVDINFAKKITDPILAKIDSLL